MTGQTAKAERFRALHRRAGAFIIPNPWDVGSARLLESFGFVALASTSSGFAQSIGKVDGGVTLEEKLRHCAALSEATHLPISADLERCFADDPEGVANTIRRVAETGVVGASIEDYSADPSRPIYGLDHAVERVQAAAEAAHGLDFPFTLTARAEGLLRKAGDMDDTIRRLVAFESVGAEVLYAPALRTLEEVSRVAGALGKPLNVLGAFLPNATLDELASAGAKRVSTGGALASVAYGSLMRAGAEMMEHGSFGWYARLSESKGLDDRLRR